MRAEECGSEGEWKWGGIEDFYFHVISNDDQPTVAQNLVALRHIIIHFPTSSGVSEQAGERMSAAERASEASSAEQANE